MDERQVLKAIELYLFWEHRHGELTEYQMAEDIHKHIYRPIIFHDISGCGITTASR